MKSPFSSNTPSDFSISSSSLTPEEQPEVNLVPLLDSLFLLLFVLLLIVAQSKSRSSIHLDLPQASQATPMDSDFSTLSLDGSGHYHFGKNKTQNLVDLKTTLLSLQNENKKLLFQADANLPYKKIIETLDQFKLWGLTKIALETNLNKTIVKKTK